MDSLLHSGFVCPVRSTSRPPVSQDLPAPGRSRAWRAWALLSALAAVSSPAIAAVEGYGKDATGGAGGSVCTVTISAETGTGSFNWCLSKGGNQTIQFAVASATVYRTSYLRSNTTLDGCANGRNGVTLNQPADKDRAIAIEGPVSNVVVRCIRFQGSGPRHSGYSVISDLLRLDGTGGQVSKVVVDHCTFAGSTDGALDTTGNVSDVTESWNLFYGTALNQLMKYNTRQRISLHHNVYTANGERNPQIKGNASSIDFVSNAVYNETITSDGAGDSFSPYGTRLWNSSSDSPGNVKANLRSNFYGGANARLGIQTDSGASAAGIYIAPDNVCAGGCPSSPASTANAVTAGYEVTATSVGCMASQMLPNVGSPTRTSTDQAKVDAVVAALPASCTSSSYALTVSKSGTGSGTVTSSPTGVTCGTDCLQSYAPGTVVALSKTAAAGSTFTGWSGACTGTGSCQVTMSAAKSVAATFKPAYTLTVTKSGTGSGTVTSSPTGVSCGSDCSQSYASGTVVTLSRTAAAGSTFLGWSGACTGTSTCQVTMSAAHSVTASFGRTTTNALASEPAGSGAPPLSSPQVECRGDCAERGSAAPQPGGFHTVPPCRAYDTRRDTRGGPALEAGETRFFTFFGICGIPTSARAVSVNLTVAQPTSAGELQVYPADLELPEASAISYGTGVARGNSSIAGLSASGELAVHSTQASGTAHVVIDVNGYFE
jgi:hypothetical protein